MELTRLVFVGLLCLAMSVRADRTASNTKSVRVGVLLCLSGECAEWGSSAKRGVELAIQEVNSQGGVLGHSLELVVQDSQDTTPARAVSAFRVLTADPSVHFVIGPSWTIAGLSLAPLMARRGDMAVISPSIGVREFTEAGGNLFSTWPHDQIATTELVRYAFSKGWKKIALFGSQDPFCMAQSDVLAKEVGLRGGTLLVREDPVPTERDLRAEALRIRSASPDVVIATNYQADVVASHLRKVGYGGPLLTVVMDKERVRSAQGALEGCVFAMYDKPTAQFVASFKERYGAEPGNSADTAYDALKILALAITQAGSFSAPVVARQLRMIQDFPGASGTFSFDAKGAVSKKPVLWRVKGESYERVE